LIVSPLRIVGSMLFESNFTFDGFNGGFAVVAAVGEDV